MSWNFSSQGSFRNGTMTLLAPELLFQLLASYFLSGHQLGFFGLLTWTSRRVSWPCTWTSDPSHDFLPEHQVGFLDLLTWTSRIASWACTWDSWPALDFLLLVGTSARFPWSPHLNLQESFLTLHLSFWIISWLLIGNLGRVCWSPHLKLRRASWPCTWASCPSLDF
jgi:hypothetical protein